MLEKKNDGFKRKFSNPDAENCWLNSCLQLVLVGLDYDEAANERTLTSALGRELLKMKNYEYLSIDPTVVKDIIVTAENTRIAQRLSEVGLAVINERQKEKEMEQVRQTYLNLESGYQCVRDFFICLHENLINWPDVYSNFSFTLRHHTICSTCKHEFETETNQLYLEMKIPPDNTTLKSIVEDTLNEDEIVEVYCHDNCKRNVHKMKKTEIVNCGDVKFFIIILSRGRETQDGYEYSNNRVSIFDEINLR